MEKLSKIAYSVQKVQLVRIALIVATIAIIYLFLRARLARSASGFGSFFGGSGNSEPTFMDAPITVKEQELSGGIPTEQLPKANTYYQKLAKDFIDEMDGLRLTDWFRTNAFAIMEELNSLTIAELVAVDFYITEKSGFGILSWINDEYNLNQKQVAELNRKLS